MDLIIKILSSWQAILLGVFWLGVMISIIAFVHEWGHYIAARLCNVRVEAFAIGMGKEIFGFTAKKTGVRWKFCLFPIGGYVKMFGQSDVPNKKGFKYETEKDKKMSFEHKKPWQKIIISFAGPLANFVLGFIILLGLYSVYGKFVVKPIVSEVTKSSPASIAGFHKGDKIISLNGKEVSDFKYVVKKVALGNCDEMTFVIKRTVKDKELELVKTVTPVMIDDESLGVSGQRCLVGISASEIDHKTYSYLESVKQSFKDTVLITKDTFKGIGQIVLGKRSLKELSGPLKIGKMSHDASKEGIQRFTLLIVFISIGVGVMNLLPIPVLDGGHIAMNLIAIIIRRDVPAKMQTLIYNIGFVFVIAMMLTGLVNDFLFLVK